MFKALNPRLGGLLAISALIGALAQPAFAHVAAPEITIAADRLEEPVSFDGGLSHSW